VRTSTVAEQSSGQLTSKELRDLKRLRVVREALDEFKRRGISADIAVCPVCKSPRVVHITSYQDLGFLGAFQPAYYCLDCGWFGRTLTIMTNRPEDDAVIDDLRAHFADLLEEEQEAQSEHEEEEL
jgi:hypothetical protein